MDVYALEITHSLYLSMYLRNRQIWQKALLLRKVPCHQAGIYGERSLKKRLNPDSINNFSSLWNGKRFSPLIKKTELTQKARLCAPFSSTHVRPFTLSRKILVLWLIFPFPIEVQQASSFCCSCRPRHEAISSHRFRYHSIIKQTSFDVKRVDWKNRLSILFDITSRF